MKKIIDKFLKYIGVREYTNDELFEQLKKKCLLFFQYVHLRHSIRAYHEALENKEFIKKNLIYIVNQPNEDVARKHILVLIAFVDYYNSRGFV